jgi:Bax protein
VVAACVAGGAAVTTAEFSTTSLAAPASGDSFDPRSYTARNAAREGTAVPRVFAVVMPGDLADVSPAERKQRFLSLVLPLVLAVNEEIAGDRAQLLALQLHLDTGARPSGEQADWLTALARHYEVPLTTDWEADIEDLLQRVDQVPPSLALAQAALESGWGTSRFALEGNALFGERTWGERGLQEIGAAEGTRHRARSFDRLLDGVAAYMQNLNSHPAYAEFRQARAEMRSAGEQPTGSALIGHLTRYSERGNAYTRQVRKLIKANRLGDFDAAILMVENGSI